MSHGPNPLPFQDPQGENALLAGVVEAISAGLELGLLAARIAGLIVAATATDVCFVHVLDDSGTALTLTGATPPFDAAVGRIRLLLGEGVTGWVASHGEPVTITDHKEADPRYRYFPELRGGGRPRATHPVHHRPERHPWRHRRHFRLTDSARTPPSSSNDGTSMLLGRAWTTSMFHRCCCPRPPGSWPRVCALAARAQEGRAHAARSPPFTYSVDVLRSNDLTWK